MPEQPRRAAPPMGVKSPTPGRTHNLPSQPTSVVRRAQQFSAGKPSKHDKNKLMRSEGIIPIQAGSNKYASQKGMTGNRASSLSLYIVPKLNNLLFFSSSLPLKTGQICVNFQLSSCRFWCAS